MCTIMGYCGKTGGMDKVSRGLAATVSRGPDDCRIMDLSDGVLGFQRLSIMGLTPDGMQPFELNGNYVVCNGEIYGFEKSSRSLSERDIISKAAATVKYFSRCITNTEQICS